MNQKIYNLISSITSVCLAVILFICVCLAWYSSNKETTTKGIYGSTDTDECALNVELYYLTGYSNNAYTKSSDPIDYSKVSASKPIKGEEELGDTIMNKFGEGVTGVLVVATVTLYDNADGNYQLSVSTKTKDILMVEEVDSSKNIADQLNQYQNNMLSNVIYLQKATVDFDTNKVEVASNDKLSFIENEQKNTKVKLESSIQKSLADAGKTTELKFCYIMDYDDNNVNYLYEQMLTIFGKDANLNTPMLFQSDISFIVSKGSDNS